MLRKGNSFFQSRQRPRCSNYARFHNGRCFRPDKACFTYGEQGHIAKYCLKGNPGTTQATTQLQGTAIGTRTQG